MLFTLIRLLMLAGVIYLIFRGVQMLVLKIKAETSGYVSCRRCDGKGFWYASDGREKCDWCDGAGEISRTEDELRG